MHRLLSDLEARGVRTDRAMLFVIDGSKALAKEPVEKEREADRHRNLNSARGSSLRAEAFDEL